jgi:hypothetical protein
MLAQASIQFVTEPEERKLQCVQEFSVLHAVRESSRITSARAGGIAGNEVKYMIINNFLSKVSCVVWILSVGALSAGAYAAEGLFPNATVMAAPQQPTKLPDFELPNVNGGTLRSADMKGKVIVIRFWATW